MRSRDIASIVVAIALAASGTIATAADVGAQATGESSFEEATRIANELVVQTEQPLEYAMRRAQEAAAEARAAEEAFGAQLTSSAAAEGKVPEIEPDSPHGADMAYAQSLRALGQFQDPARLQVIAPALDSPSRQVRRAALEALRDGTVRDEAVLGRVWHMVTSDSDPMVQRDALEVYVRYGNQQDVLSLVQSLGRVDGPTRDIAVREWLRIEKEIADAPLADRQLERAGRR